MQLTLKTISKSVIAKTVGTASGSGGAIVGKKLGLIHLHVLHNMFKDIDIAGMAETIIYAIVGAVVGYYVTKLLQKLHKDKQS